MNKRRLSDCKAGFPSNKLALLDDKVIPSIDAAALSVAEVVLLDDKPGLSHGKGRWLAGKPGLLAATSN